MADFPGAFSEVWSPKRKSKAGMVLRRGGGRGVAAIFSIPISLDGVP
jgi:hypothetical protein